MCAAGCLKAISAAAKSIALTYLRCSCNYASRLVHNVLITHMSTDTANKNALHTKSILLL